MESATGAQPEGLSKIVAASRTKVATMNDHRALSIGRMEKPELASILFRTLALRLMGTHYLLCIMQNVQGQRLHSDVLPFLLFDRNENGPKIAYRSLSGCLKDQWR
jgi:hypothetical protein